MRVGVNGELISAGNSAMRGASLAGVLNAGDGRAREAVLDNVGVACDEEMIAGTEVDLINRARFALRSAT